MGTKKRMVGQQPSKGTPTPLSQIPQPSKGFQPHGAATELKEKPEEDKDPKKILSIFFFKQFFLFIFL